MCACRGTAGFAHVSCLAEQAKILVAEAEENNLDDKADARFARWYTCGLCEQQYHGVVMSALGWACWTSYVGRPETDWPRRFAINVLWNGLSETDHHEDAFSVMEAEYSMIRRLGAPDDHILAVQSNLAATYFKVGRTMQALDLYRNVYFGHLKLLGEEDEDTLLVAFNYASSLGKIKRFGEAKSLLSKTMPVARRVLGQSHEITIKMRMNYAQFLYTDDSATLDDLREAAGILEEIDSTARRVYGGSHPITAGMGESLRIAQAFLRDPSGIYVMVDGAVMKVVPESKGGA